MEFELKESITGDLIDDILLRGGVSDLEYHKNPDKRMLTIMKDIPEEFSQSTNILHNALEENKNIIILIDQDMDGFSASALLYRFIKNDLEYDNITYIIPDGKTHGLTTEVMTELKNMSNDSTLVIIPDAASNDTKQLEELNSYNIETLVLDHHEINVKSVHKNVFNNQIISDINKNFTGVGMVYLFCKCALYRFRFNNKIYSKDLVDKYLDLVTLGQTGDVSNIADPEIRYLTYTGVRNINNPFIKSVMERKGIDNPTTRDWSFSIISMINAVTRIGTLEEKQRLFEAMITDSEETETIEIRKKNKKTGKFDKIPTEMTLPEIVAKQCESIKTKQDKIVKDAIKNIEFLYNEKIIVAVSDDNSPSSINGLVAMKLADKHRKPVMVGKFKNDYFSGSIRAQNIDFKSILTKSELFYFVQGHSQAAGFSIPKGYLDSLYEYIEEYKFKTSNVYEVDVLTHKPNEQDIIRVELEKDVLGGNVVYPLFGYEEIEFNKRCINKRGSVLSFFDDNVTFVLFNAPDDIKEEIDNNIVNNKITMNIVGEPRINKFGNKEQSQIVIKDYEILEVEKDDELGMWGIDF
ncbi:RecJ-like ssDNA exonuclease [Staphylococcus phage S-CoN_Ph2]|nr:RecJ-like ssDNA exonuclease [Staphylococcus phage S-CoN_Ph1]WNM51675.1 RecJ-like ssDNA exonuclease [Staphylococcus phage S-CoN_Ph2]WNM51837.1 RecJ-like ssDNA exonuclease [Staphylococcus phage S-CoN_Ph3]WNM51917.1 RecJ-like ssDNA exonuclease [Staphylococcus phage S-CoN_Ph4]WNM52100.1 RecJ-like ssDNA exonuclease [Staphylococcus phage S-CoN_Ph5]WNM52510.1 RecJ-like ssDNA exonuclease [Staphylococcus phage S-CoN_Ph7]WNM52767.1 RecJ-like ssDNA exonuclease [Staphylococcus phage S-CoN_Ph9]WNM5341